MCGLRSHVNPLSFVFGSILSKVVLRFWPGFLSKTGFWKACPGFVQCMAEKWNNILPCLVINPMICQWNEFFPPPSASFHPQKNVGSISPSPKMFASKTRRFRWVLHVFTPTFIDRTTSFNVTKSMSQIGSYPKGKNKYMALKLSRQTIQQCLRVLPQPPAALEVLSYLHPGFLVDFGTFFWKNLDFKMPHNSGPAT